MRGITLVIFGAVAQISKEPSSAKPEFFVAIAGPSASSLSSAFGFFLVAMGTFAGHSKASWPAASCDDKFE